MKYIVIPDGKNTSILKDIKLHVINPRSMCSEKMFEIPCLWFVDLSLKKKKSPNEWCGIFLILELIWIKLFFETYNIRDVLKS